MAEDKDRLAARERANLIRLKRMGRGQSYSDFQPMYIGGGYSSEDVEANQEQQESNLNSEIEESAQESEQTASELSADSGAETLQTEEEEDAEEQQDIKQKRKAKQIQAYAEQFLGMGAKVKSIGKCPVCGEKSIYFSTKATDNLLGVGLLAVTGNYMITYYCMNPKCSANWKSGKCRRKFNATPADAVKFNKNMAMEWRRVFRIDK